MSLGGIFPCHTHARQLGLAEPVWDQKACALSQSLRRGQHHTGGTRLQKVQGGIVPLTDTPSLQLHTEQGLRQRPETS